ncbi:fibronectin type III domain-containing protein [Flavobacterium sp. J49]|uniref:fibronectin type III domain-containing protein n=1 Tax=Flavobacterium sp. J49 TaxID=2718534 RepID=UPI0015942D04|nr:fibronectin type III domain-containing protein [Flavobacterium sp. J49]MBF6642267.1 fibronectin type III domain-containing protein [Flavobacterium sp. J49]NIC03513.1 fibronectin type III domain-containing protein [Flavobacterium sp. J49]
MNTNSNKENIFSVKKQLCAFFTAMLLVLMSMSGHAQVSTYGFTEAVGTYTALTAPTVAYTVPWDDHTSGAAHQANIGFNFTYNGLTQTQCYISPNGFISFGVQPLPNTYLPLSVATVFTGGGTISALGMDLISTTDDIVYKTIGSAPNRIFVVQWTNVRRKALTGNFNFQIRLLETSNTIELSYGVCAPDDTTVLNTQIGIRGATNDFLQGEVNNRLQTGTNANSTWLGKTTVGIANSSTVRTSVTEYPNSGLKYTYTPSAPCVTPTGTPAAFVVGSTAVNATTFLGNSFTAASPAPTNYLVLRSTVNVPPTNIEVPNRTYWAVNNVIAGTYTVVSVSNATTFNQSALTSNTTYYYWVIPYNAGCLGGPYYNLSNMITTSKTTCIAAPTGVNASTIEGNSFTASWLSVAGATNYLIDVSTNIGFTAILPAYNGVSTGLTTDFVVSGLNPLTTYYFRVRAVGISCSINSTVVTVATPCGAFSIPYFQNFDTTPVNTLPTCFVITDDNEDGVYWKVQNTSSASNPNSMHLATNNIEDSDDWFFTAGLNLTAGVTYRLRFKYNTLSAGSYAENLRVRLGTGQSEAAMNNTILDLSSIINTVYQTATVDFTPVTNNIFYIGFQGYSFASQSKIMVDDISVIVSPTCFEPTNLIVTSVGSTTAGISWNASSPEPSNGYEYYVSTSNATPGGSVTPTGSVGVGITTATITGLTPATLYYVWVRGKCNGTDRSVWSNIETFSTDCATPTSLTVTNGTLCGGGSTTLNAVGAPGSTIEWYAEATGETLLYTGSNYVTPTLFASTTYYAQSRAPGGLVLAGPISPLLHGGALGLQQTPTFISFNVSAATTLQSFDIYPQTSGQSGQIVIRNASNVQIATYNFVTTVSGGSTPQTINLALNLAQGNYFVYFNTLPAAGLVVNIDSASYPYTSSIANIVGNGFDNTFYLYAYNWKFSNICRSLLTPVTATVTTAPAISFSSTSSIICKGETTGLVTVSGAASYNNFTWNTSTGLSGSIAAGFAFQPITTTTYNLTASQTSGSLCTSVISHTVTVKPEPPAISIVPSSATICEGAIQSLTGSLAAATPVTIYSENFNSGTDNWIKTNASTGGVVANAAWTLRTSVYTYTSSYWNINVSSNDASKFYFSNSDAQGSPGTNRTLTYLQSPAISLVGYTTATLNFYHYLRYIGGNKARVEVSIDGGNTWAILRSFLATQGTASNFSNATVVMNSYVGNADVRIRFLYEATWDYGWAIDNVKISGNLAAEVTWDPPTGLYFNAGATDPYVSGTPTGTIYAKPAATTVYTGSVVGANGCSASATSTITVLSAPAPGILSSDQIVCANWAANDLTLAGAGASIIRWEYATNAAFTTGLTTIANTSTTLTAAQIGSFTGNRYYRAVVQSGSCPVVYSNGVFVGFPSTTWNGSSWSSGVPNISTKAIFNGNYTSTGNLSVCSVEVLSGNVIINSGHTLTAQNDVKVTGGTLTFQNNASLVQVNNLNNTGAQFANTGNITYKRNSTPVKIFDYIYWSTPVSPQTLLDFSPDSPLFFYFDAAAGNWAYANTTAPMVPGKGYLIRAPENAPFNETTPNTFAGSFIGVPNTGNVTIPVVGGANQFNLFGNPYPSALSADLFLSDVDNVPLIDATIYLWTHNTPIANGNYNAADYAVYNYSGGVGTGTAAPNVGLNNSVPNGKIASGQGFFVKGLSSGNLSFKNSMRLVGNNDQFFRMNTPPANHTANTLERHRFWLDIFNEEGAFKQLLIAYVENATNTGMDRGFDGEMVDIGNAVTLYATQEDKKLSIQGRALPFAVSDVIPVGYKSLAAGTYTVKLSNFDGLFDQQNIYLEDTLLNVIHNLKQSDYTFTTEAGTFDNRFSVVFTDASLGVNGPTFNANQVVVYKNTDHNFVILSGNQPMQSVKVFDIRGRLLLEQNNINATQTVVSGGLANEVLLLQITTVNGEVVTKKVIR